MTKAFQTKYRRLGLEVLIAPSSEVDTMPWRAGALMKNEVGTRKRARIHGRYRKARSPGAAEGKDGVGGIGVRADDWLVMLQFENTMLEVWGEARKRGVEEAKRWREREREREREERWMPEEDFVFLSMVPLRKRWSCTSQR